MPCPGLRRCRADCLHRLMVEGYYDARQGDLALEEVATGGWPTEVAEWRSQGRTRDFHRWLRSGGWEPWRVRVPELEALEEAEPEGGDWVDAWEDAG